MLIVSFLQDIVGERNKENVLTAEMTIEEDFTDNENADLRAIYDVRNYVIVRDLSYMLLNFQEDLGHLIGWVPFVVHKWKSIRDIERYWLNKHFTL